MCESPLMRGFSAVLVSGEAAFRGDMRRIAFSKTRLILPENTEITGRSAKLLKFSIL